jgi:Na+/melibiose symporter-like transporter
VILNALGFVVSIALLRNVKANDPKPPPSNKHPLRDIQDGFRFIWSQPLLRTLAWASGLWHLLFYGFAALHVIFATRELGMTPGMLGVAQMIGGLGVLASSLMLKPLTKRFGPTGAMLIGVGLCTFAYASTRSFLPICSAIRWPARLPAPPCPSSSTAGDAVPDALHHPAPEGHAG